MAISTGLGKAPIDWGTNLKANIHTWRCCRVYIRYAYMPSIHRPRECSLSRPAANKVLVSHTMTKWRLHGITDHLVVIVFFSHLLPPSEIDIPRLPFERQGCYGLVTFKYVRFHFQTQ